MAIIINDNIKVNAGKPTDAKYLNNVTPYTGTSQVLSVIPIPERHLGLTVNVEGVEYWFDGGVADTDLVIKSESITNAGGGITGATNGLTKIANNRVVFGGSLTGDTTINGGGVLNLGSLSSNLSGYNLISSGASTIQSKNGLDILNSGTDDLVVAAQNSTQLILKSETGNTAVLSDFTGAVGFDLDAVNNVFTIIDNREIGRGIQYFTDYSDFYTNRSLVDKGYVDAVAAGLDPKQSVRYATTQNIDLTSGTTVSIDGFIINDGDRVLVKDQSNKTENGIYDWISGSGFTRSNDFDDQPDGEVSEGALVPVTSGSTNINTIWVLVTKDPITLGTTDLNFTLFSQILDIVGGGGVDVNTAGATRTISLDLATNSGLELNNQSDSGKLKISSTFDGLGSTITNGVLNLNIEDAAATGSEINVQINTGGTNQLMVDVDDVNSALGNPIISANNGLTKDGNNVRLGGTLTGNTFIDLNTNGLVFGTGNSITNTVSVANLAIEDLDVGALTDAVLVRENGTGIIKGVDSDLFGEDNNLYSLTSVTTTTLDENSFVILVDTSSSPQTVTLPVSPANGRAYRIKDKSGNAFMNSITVTGGTIDGESSVSINTDYGAFDVVYSESDNEWYVLSFNN